MTNNETPNLLHVVEQVFAKNRHLADENSEASITELMWRIGDAILKVDKNWAFLSKDPGEKHIVLNGQRISEDALIHVPSNQVVDIISNARGNSPAGATWIPVSKRPNNNPVQIQPFVGEEEKEKGKKPMPNESMKELTARISELTARVTALEKLVIKNGDMIHIQTNDGEHFFCAEGGGGNDVNASRTTPLAWETFKLVKS